MSRKIDKAVTLLPEPDSPTIANVSPDSTSNETPSTAVTVPRDVRKRVTRLRTLSSGVSISGPAHLERCRHCSQGAQNPIFFFIS